MEVNLLGRILIFFGLVLVALGAILILAHRLPFFGKLPGDIYIHKKNFIFYFPILSCLLISLIISFVLWLFWRR